MYIGWYNLNILNHLFILQCILIYKTTLKGSVHHTTLNIVTIEEGRHEDGINKTFNEDNSEDNKAGT